MCMTETTMMRWIRTGAVTIGGWALSGMGLAQSEYVLERDTDSVWVTSDFGDSRAVMEWRADGTFTKYEEPFNPFAFREPRADFGYVENRATSFEGRFAIMGSYRGFYVRDSLGAWDFIAPFGQAGAFGCNETASASACLMVGFNNERGTGVLVRNEAQAISVWYWTGSAYRPASRRETIMALEVEEEVAAWSADGSFGLVSGFADGGVYSYKIVTDAGIETKTVAVGSAAPGIFVQRRGRFVSTAYRVGTDGGGGGGGNESPSPSGNQELRVHELVDPTGTPRVDEIFAVTAAPDVLLMSLGFDDEGYYYSHGSDVLYVDLDARTTSVVDTCPIGTRSSILEASRPGFRLLTCGARISLWRGGARFWTAVAGGPVAEAKVFSATSGAVDMLVRWDDGTLERLRDGQPPRRGQPGLLASVGYLYPKWEEGDRICGVSRTEITARTLCRAEGAWTETSLPIGTPFEVTINGDFMWALSPDAAATTWTLYRRPVVDTPRAGWTPIQAWPADETLPRLIPALDHVAVDVNGAGIWTFDGTAFVETHSRGGRTLQAKGQAVDGAGYLYETCIDGTGLTQICRVAPDGAVAHVRVDIFGDASIVPMARGVLVVPSPGSAPHVVRDTRSIPLGRLYGEFAVDPSVFQMVDVGRAKGGEVLLRRLRYDPATMSYLTALFSFDGRTLTPGQVTPPRHAPFARGDIAFGATIYQVWQGADGLWRRMGNEGPDFLTVGASPFDAAFAGASFAPNFVNHAFVQGSRVVLGTGDGIWTCPLDAATALGADAFELRRTRGCVRVRRMQRVERIHQVGGRYIVQQGRRIVELAALNGGEMRVLSRTLTARGLTVTDGVASWVEDGAVLRWTGGVRSERPLPAAEGAVSGDWFCAARGLHHYENGAWRRLAQECSAVQALPGGVAAVDERSLHFCDGRGCQSVALPRPFLADSRLGVLGEGTGHERVILAIGGRIFTHDGTPVGAFRDDTPHTAHGSAVLTEASAVDGGVVALLGGGVVLLPEATGLPQARHVRLD